jgi:peptidoglycan/xylan/chitin deacetylase (PgdA/CDA1 family)
MPDDAPDAANGDGLSRRRLLVAGLSGISLAACSPGTSTHTDAAASSTTSGAASPSPSAHPSTSATAEPTASGPPRVATTRGPDITHGPRDQAQLALTFHGQGPLTLARDILRSCARADASITVFAVGTWLESNPAIGPEIVRAGHELGNHTWSHQQMKQLTAAEATREAVKGAQALVSAVGTRGIWFRPSGTQASTPTIRAAAHTAGYQRCVSYDVDPQDFRDPGAAAVRDRTLAAAKAGSIVSLHFGHAGTAEALPAILDGLKAKGLKPVTLSQLLADA